MRKKGCFISLLLILLILPFENNAQDINALLKEAQQLEISLKDAEALQKYQEVLKYQPNNLTALTRASELSSMVGKQQPTKQKQNDYYKNGKIYAQKALQVNPNSAEANMVMSLAMGRLAQSASGEEKIKVVKEIKYYAEKAIQLDPNNFKAYHVLARWHYEVSDLSTVEKWLVKVRYEALPRASLDDAIKYYEKSRQLNPSFLLNYLELARAYHRKDNDKKAIELVETMLKMPNRITDDPHIKQKAKKFLEEIK